MVNEFAGDPLGALRRSSLASCRVLSVSCDLCPGDDRLERMGMSIEHRATNLGVLAGMIGALRIASFVALSLKRYERR